MFTKPSNGRTHLLNQLLPNVTVSVTDPQDEDQEITPTKSKVTVAFVEYGKRNGESTREYLETIRKAVKGIPGRK